MVAALSDIATGIADPTETVARARMYLEAAKGELGSWFGEGGFSSLGYFFSNRLFVGGTPKGCRALARDLTAYADALEQFDEAVRIAKWNQGAGA